MYSFFIKSWMSVFYYMDIYNFFVFIYCKMVNSNGFIYFIIRLIYIFYNKIMNIIWKDRYGIDKLFFVRFQNLLLFLNVVIVNIRIKRNMKDYSIIYIFICFFCRLLFMYFFNYIFGCFGK